VSLSTTAKKVERMRTREIYEHVEAVIEKRKVWVSIHFPTKVPRIMDRFVKAKQLVKVEDGRRVTNDLQKKMKVLDVVLERLTRNDIRRYK
jgi:hypothetical protein